MDYIYDYQLHIRSARSGFVLAGVGLVIAESEDKLRQQAFEMLAVLFSLEFSSRITRAHYFFDDAEHRAPYCYAMYRVDDGYAFARITCAQSAPVPFNTAVYSRAQLDATVTSLRSRHVGESIRS